MVTTCQQRIGYAQSLEGVALSPTSRPRWLS